MTTVTFTTRGERIERVEMSGHAELAPDEEPDILCAALTSAIRLVETTVNDVLGVAAAVKMREEDAYLSLKLPGDMGQENEALCQTLLAGLMVHCEVLAEEYPEHLSVIDMEV